MKKVMAWLLAFLLLGGAAALGEAEETPIPIRVLLLPKFEVGELSGDFPGEAQYYYEAYLAGGEAYEVPGAGTLYVKDGVALCLTGMGKVNAAITTAAVLTDRRFDFSAAYVISTGCAGSAMGTTVMGDVFVISEAVDYDLGHRVDSRELKDPEGTTWFRDPSFDDAAVVRLDPALTEAVYALVRDVPLETTERTRAFMAAAFDGAAWAVRDPRVLRGTTVTGDNYWKGIHGHNSAAQIVESYGCADPYALTEMEDVAVGRALQRLGMADRYIIIRDSVNIDVFMAGETPEHLWGPDSGDQLSSEESVESADIFETARKNNFAVGSAVIDAILRGELGTPEPALRPGT